GERLPRAVATECILADSRAAADSKTGSLTGLPWHRLYSNGPHLCFETVFASLQGKALWPRSVSVALRTNLENLFSFGLGLIDRRGTAFAAPTLGFEPGDSLRSEVKRSRHVAEL